MLSSARTDPPRTVEPGHRAVRYRSLGPCRRARRKAVGREVDHEPVVRNRLPNQPLGLRAIRLVLMLHYPLTHLGRCFAGRFGMETRMTDGSIQVNEQTAYSGGHQRRRKYRCQRSSHDERDGIVAAVRFQQPLLPMKQVADTTRESVAAVL